jgi:hypothetical protein
MNDLLHQPGMIPAILLACASVTAILWVVLASLSPGVPQPAESPVIHAYLLPMIIRNRSLPVAAPVHPAPHHHAHRPAHRQPG